MINRWKTPRVLEIIRDRDSIGIGIKKFKMLLDPITETNFNSLLNEIEKFSNKRKLKFTRTKCFTNDGESMLPPGERLGLPTLVMDIEELTSWLQNNSDLLQEFRSGGPERYLTVADFYTDPSFTLDNVQNATPHNPAFSPEPVNDTANGQNDVNATEQHVAEKQALKEQQIELWQQTAKTNLYADITIEKDSKTSRLMADHFYFICMIMAEKWRGKSHVEADRTVRPNTSAGTDSRKDYVYTCFEIAPLICALNPALKLPPRRSR